MKTVTTTLVLMSLSTPVLAGPLEDQARGLFKPLPARFESSVNPVTREKVELGKRLYFEKRLSKNHDTSCNSCHDLGRYGVDGKKTSPGHRQQLGDRNSPTVYNAGHHLAQFWDGRAADLEEQAKGPVLNPVEMAMASPEAVVAVVASIPGYAPLFRTAFPGEKEPITYDNIARAIGAFERTLVTPSRFDRYLGGDDRALSAAEKAGLKAFIDAGCIACHNGEPVGGMLYQKFGLVKPVPGMADVGRFKVTGNEADRGFFKVPSLRNIEKTAPYMHDGSVATLEEAISIMATHQLGKTLSREETASIATFLGSLTGTLPRIAEPAPLPGGKDTPRPDPT